MMTDGRAEGHTSFSKIIICADFHRIEYIKHPSNHETMMSAKGGEKSIAIYDYSPVLSMARAFLLADDNSKMVFARAMLELMDT